MPAGAFALTEAVGSTSFVKVSNFGALDTLTFTGVGSNHLIVESRGSDVILTVNAQGMVSQITLVGVLSGSQIVGDLASFNALSIGRIVIGS